ncbi:MAG: apolipoprotein N-acyltransferase, partial [Thermotogae bacterium]|nr:apolipoprotein N-acyltransferase [Thermotogota bacterium]
MKRFILLAGGSLALLLSSAPLFIFPLALVAFVPLFMSYEQGFKKNLIYGTLFSFPYFAFHLWWIKNLQAGQGLGPIFYIAILLLFLVKSALFGLWFSLSSRLSTPMQVGLSYAIYEWLLEHMGDLSFPWASLFYSSLGFLPFAQTASIFGPYFISFLIVAFNYSLFRVIRWKSRRDLVGLWIYASIIGLLSIYGYSYMKKGNEANSSIKVAIVQPNVLPRFQYDPREWRETMEAFEKIADTLSKLDYDIAIFSESAIIGMLNYEQNRQMLLEFLQKTGRPIVLGSTRLERRDGEKLYFNTAFLLDTNLQVLDYYDKVRIVPFGENLPFYEFLPPFIRNLQLGQGDYSRGRSLQPIDFHGVKIGILICYESIFPSLSRALVLNGAQMLAVITNDGWFGKSLGP